jgi:hypothetical protein
VLNNQYVVNVLSDFITLTITVIAGALIYQLTRRRNLQSFFAMSNKRIVVYLSNLTISLGGALDPQSSSEPIKAQPYLLTKRDSFPSSINCSILQSRA